MPWFTPAELSEDGSGEVSESTRSITDRAVKEAGLRVLPPGTVLITSRASIGHVAVTTTPATTNQGFASLIPSSPAATWFVYNWVLAHKKQLEVEASGSTFLEISGRKLAAYETAVPSPEEQSALGSFFSELDALVNATSNRARSLTSLKKTMLVKMFPQGTASTPEVRFEGFEGEWGSGTLGDIGRTYTGLSGKTKEDFGHGDGRFVTYMNVFSNPVIDPSMVEPTPVDSRQNTVRNGDVLFTTSSEVPNEAGMSCVVDSVDGGVYLNSFCFGFRPNQRIERDYWAYMLRSRSVRTQFEMMAQGISRFNISPSRAMAVEVPLPSLPEQQAIGSYFRSLDALSDAEQKKLAMLRNFKSALLTQMFV